MFKPDTSTFPPNKKSKMLGKFEELKRFNLSRTEESKTDKRRRLYTQGIDAPKKRRRSLFVNAPSRLKGDPDKIRPFVVQSEEKISEFSSSSDEENDTRRFEPVQKKTLVEACEFPLTTGKIKNNECRSKRRRSVPSYVTRQNEIKALINWSDSDDESKIASLKTIATEKGAKVDFLDIDHFESPVKHGVATSKTLAVEQSQNSIEDSTPTQKSSIEEQEIENCGAENDDSTVRPFDSSKKKRYKDVKGGLAEQLRKVKARERSSLVFWQHSANKERVEKTKNNEGNGNPILLKVLHIENNYSLVTLTCSTIEAHPKTVVLLLPDDKMKDFLLSKDDMLKIFPPFRRINVPGEDKPIVLCAYFLKAVTNFSREADSEITYDFLEDGTPEQGHQIIHQNDRNEEVAAIVQENNQLPSHLLSDFCKCSFSQPSSFLATVTKATILCENSCPPFSRTGGESILETIRKRSTKGERTQSLEVLFLLTDDKYNTALLRYPFSKYKISGLGNLSATHKKTFAFCNFHLHGVKNACFDPTIFSFTRKCEEEDSKPHLSKPCFVFSYSNESCISTCSNDVSLKSEKIFEDFNRAESHSKSNRVSFHACCICIVPHIHQGNPATNSKHYQLMVMRLPSIEDKVASSSSTTSCQSVSLLEKLPSCYVPKYVAKCLLEKNQILFLKDVMQESENSKLRADKYTEICLVHTNKYDNINEMHDMSFFGSTVTDETTIQFLQGQQISPIPSLSTDSKINTVVKVDGLITGIDEETAMFWAVCGKCGKEVNNDLKDQIVLCPSCNKEVVKKIHVQLDILVSCEQLFDVNISVKLLENTVFEYLPMQITEEFNGYDVDLIIGKKFGPKICYIASKKQSTTQQGNTGSVCSINLKETFVAKGLDC